MGSSVEHTLLLRLGFCVLRAPRASSNISVHERSTVGENIFLFLKSHLIDKNCGYFSCSTRYFQSMQNSLLATEELPISKDSA